MAIKNEKWFQRPVPQWRVRLPINAPCRTTVPILSRTTAPILTLHSVGAAATGHSTPPGKSASGLHTRALIKGCSNCNRHCARFNWAKKGTVAFGGLFTKPSWLTTQPLQASVTGEMLKMMKSEEVQLKVEQNYFAHTLQMRNMRPDLVPFLSLVGNSCTPTLPTVVA